MFFVFRVYVRVAIKPGGCPARNADKEQIRIRHVHVGPFSRSRKFWMNTTRFLKFSIQVNFEIFEVLNFSIFLYLKCLSLSHGKLSNETCTGDGDWCVFGSSVKSGRVGEKYHHRHHHHSHYDVTRVHGLLITSRIANRDTQFATSDVQLHGACEHANIHTTYSYSRTSNVIMKKN